eukprot:TRINITY_DN3060_c0_g1_i1.p1 TRINITY_DN3060_c0_g1~~TRINITY_DN3060_c0_g1_i1.p1  ORF type:complete len:167 (-),score=29.68 TRINITY_DN3060_c0_g1_i1:96-596(-)
MVYSFRNCIILITIFLLDVIFVRGELEPSRGVDLEGSIEPGRNRGGRLLVTTSIVTSTLQTSSSCFVFMGAAPTTACSRKKRAIIDSPIPGVVGITVTNSKPREEEKEKKALEVPQKEEEISGLNRLARFLYFITTTSTQVSTTFTQTTTFTLVVCTPANLDIKMC